MSVMRFVREMLFDRVCARELELMLAYKPIPCESWYRAFVRWQRDENEEIPGMPLMSIADFSAAIVRFTPARVQRARGVCTWIYCPQLNPGLVYDAESGNFHSGNENL